MLIMVIETILYSPHVLLIHGQIMSDIYELIRTQYSFSEVRLSRSQTCIILGNSVYVIIISSPFAIITLFIHPMQTLLYNLEIHTLSPYHSSNDCFSVTLILNSQNTYAKRTLFIKCGDYHQLLLKSRDTYTKCMLSLNDLIIIA